MHDRIFKLIHKLNGIYLRGIDDDHTLFSFSYCLNKIRGGVTGVGTAKEIISNIVSVADSSAYHMFDRQFIESHGQKEPNYIPPVPLSYLKIGEMVSVNHNKVVCIAISNRFPNATLSNGVSVNIKAV